MRAVTYLRGHDRLTNRDYQQEFQTARRTAALDLKQLVAAGVLVRVGTTGRGAYYRLGKRLEGARWRAVRFRLPVCLWG